MIESMADVRRVVRSARMVLVIDDAPWSQPAWLTQLQELFFVATISTLAGASVAIEGQEVAAVILVMSPSQQARTWVSALRRHPSLEHTPVFVLARDSVVVAADLLGLPDVDVIEPELADFHLSLRVGAIAPRMSSRPAPKRFSDPAPTNDTRSLESLVPKGPNSEPLLVVGRLAPSAPPAAPAPEESGLQRFTHACVERGERGLALCELLSQRSATNAERARAAEELLTLFVLCKREAALLAQRELALLFGMAERVVSRLNAGRGQLVVPRGIAGLLSALADLDSIETAPGGALLQQLATLDVELHKMRLSSAIER